MAISAELLKRMQVSPSIVSRMIRWGWIDSLGNPKRWFDHQRSNHNAMFEEPRERKQRKKPFQKSNT
jgi:hypothetical protein